MIIPGSSVFKAECHKIQNPMRKLYLPFITITVFLSLVNGSCTSKKNKLPGKQSYNILHGVFNHKSNLPFDSNLLISFYRSYPALNKYQKDVVVVYRQHKFTHIWYDSRGVVEFGNTLFSKVRELNVEGISSKFPYQEKIDGIFVNEKENTLSPIETELMLTNLYLFYAEKVYKGLNDTTTKALGWLLPPKHVSYAALLDSIISDPQLLNRDDSVLFSQYYKLRTVLQRYREIEKKGGWNSIDLDPRLKAYKPGDTAKAIRQIRQRLFITGDLRQDNKSNQYDNELVEGMIKYQKRNGFNPDKLIFPKHIKEMNVPIGIRIKQIIVNMERCRWISPEFAKAREYIVVNIPSYTLDLVLNGKNEFESPVIVGKNVTKTVIFSGKLSYIVFCPYWNLPVSIINKEVKPGMAKHKNYLETHNMEWNNGQVRQKPGKNNSLGRVKFIFPNVDDIYMHDTPAKSLFADENRAFSHGCIRVEKPRDLAVEILKDDPAWTPIKIDAAMHAGKESTYPLKSKIPVYIGYFTTWVDDEGKINFYDDIYGLDERLAELLIDEK
jgi:L,D-transpeptidase YcbB